MVGNISHRSSEDVSEIIEDMMIKVIMASDPVSRCTSNAKYFICSSSFEGCLMKKSRVGISKS